MLFVKCLGIMSGDTCSNVVSVHHIMLGSYHPMTSWEEAGVSARKRTGVGSRRSGAPRETARRGMGHFGPAAMPGEDIGGCCPRTHRE
jgi:hypothetical protein